MSEKDIAELIVNYFSENLFKILGVLISSLGTIIAATWFVSKSWYKREIEHLKSSKTSECNILYEQINYLNQKLQDNNSYAKGIIEVAKNQLIERKNEAISINETNIASEYESKITNIKEQYDKVIANLTKEKDSLYQLLKESKTDKSEMLERLYIIINYTNSIDTDKKYFNQINHCYNELFKQQNEDNFFDIYSKFTIIIVDKILYSFINLKNEKNILENKFLNNRIDNLNHTIKIIKPFMLNDNNSNSSFKELRDKIKKSLNDLERSEDKNEDDNEK